MPAEAPVTTCPKTRPSAPTSSPLMKMRAVVPSPVAALKYADSVARSAEQRRPMVTAPGAL